MKNGSKIWSNLLVHAAAIVADGQQRILSRHKPGMLSAVSQIKDGVSHFDSDLADPGNSVPGVNTEIGQDLVDLDGVHFNRPQAHPGPPSQLNLFADEPPEHLDHALHGLVQVKHHGNDGLLACKSKQLTGYVR